MANPLSHKPTLPHQWQSLTRRTLLKMSLSLAGVIVAVTGISYFYLMRSLETAIVGNLSDYVTERGKRESELFRLAEDNHELVKQEFLRVLDQTELDVPLPASMQKWSDGTIRNFSENTSLDQFDTNHKATLYISPKSELTAALRRRIVAADSFLTDYGSAWHNRFINTYLILPENALIGYFPGVPWGLQIPPQMDMTQEEYFYISDRKHNPERKTAWTGLFFDAVAEQWMVTAATPIDDAQGRQLAMVGHDIILNELLHRAVNDRLKGTYNLIFRADGRLIVDPNRMAAIQEKQGNFNIVDSGDAHLSRIFDAVKSLKPGAVVVANAADDEYLAATKLDGPDWYFVVVYPKSLLNGIALQNANFVLIVGAIALLIDVLVLFSILRYQVTQPLNRLLVATGQLAKGNFNVQLDTSRQDELGRLATSFTSMAQQLRDSFAQLAAQNDVLEARVQERTQELSEALIELKQTHIQLVQSEKMSSLGQLVAGVAHEINNPVNFIHGNLVPARTYAEDLLELIELYQSDYPQPSTRIQAAIESIDLEFVKGDLPKLLESMAVGSQRISDIVKSLRNFSRLDEAELKMADLHEGIESTLMILHHRLKDKPGSLGINIVRNYGVLPLVHCCPGQLNQVFMNILSNAIDAIYERQSCCSDYVGQIQIQTDVSQSGWVKIAIADNGLGMSEAVLAKLFDPFFTTKPVGRGTGLGLSICYQIVTETHQGKLDCYSMVGQGTEFVIEIPVRAERLPLDNYAAL